MKKIDIEQVYFLIDTLIPIDCCRRFRFIPLSRRSTSPLSVVVAMVNPSDLNAQDELNRILLAKKINWTSVIITLKDYNLIISQYLDLLVKKEEAVKTKKLFNAQAEIEEPESLEDDPDTTSDVIPEDNPIANLVNKVLLKAINEKASEIHRVMREDGNPVNSEVGMKSDTFA